MILPQRVFMSSDNVNFPPVPAYPPDNMGDYLTPAQLSALTGVALSSLYAHHRPHLPCVHIGGRDYLYHPDAVALLKARVKQTHRAGSGRKAKRQGTSTAFYDKVVKQ